MQQFYSLLHISFPPGMLLPGILCIVLGYIDCTQWIIALVLVTIAVSLLGCVYGAGYVVNHADIAPKYASLLFGISNTTATIPGFMAPSIIGIITKDVSQKFHCVKKYALLVFKEFMHVF